MIDSTLKYREYKTVIKSEFNYFEEGDLPSLTFCPRDRGWNKLKDKNDVSLFCYLLLIDEMINDKIALFHFFELADLSMNNL